MLPQSTFKCSVPLSQYDMHTYVHRYNPTYVDKVSKDFSDLCDGYESWSAGAHRAVHKFCKKNQDQMKDLIRYDDLIELKNTPELTNVGVCCILYLLNIRCR